MKTKSMPVITALLLIILGVLCFIDKSSIDNYENRTLADYSMVFNPDVNSITYRDNVIERFEEAMKDQFFLRNDFITSYLYINNMLSNISVRLLYVPSNDKKQYSYTEIGDYINIQGRGFISYAPEPEKCPDYKIQIHIDQIKRLHELYPDLKMYVYYVSQVDDTGWFNDFLGTDVPDFYSQIKEMLPEYVKISQLKYKNLMDYEYCHYRSDHHWNYNGARRGYEDIYSMMKEDLDFSTIKTPIKKWNFSELYDFDYRGSFAHNLGDLYRETDEFIAFEYDIPQREIYALDPQTFAETPLKELGLYEEYCLGHIDPESDHYISYYGTGVALYGDKRYNEGNAIYIIKNKKPETNHNLLIYGDSYNRAIRDELASHFDTTLYFQRDIMLNFDNINIDLLIDKYDIDVMLFCGWKSIWKTDSYVFSFSKDMMEETTE